MHGTRVQAAPRLCEQPLTTISGSGAVPPQFWCQRRFISSTIVACARHTPGEQSTHLMAWAGRHSHSGPGSEECSYEQYTIASDGAAAWHVGRYDGALPQPSVDWRQKICQPLLGAYGQPSVSAGGRAATRHHTRTVPGSARPCRRTALTQTESTRGVLRTPWPDGCSLCRRLRCNGR